jgi:ABC-type phosphate transport system substrate-binding protein
MGVFSTRRILSACALSATAAVMAAAPGAASAATQCSGSNIVAAGSTLQKLAQKEVWEPEFNKSTNAKACSGAQGSKAKPTVSYESIGSGAGLEKWGVKGHAFEAGSFAIVTTDEPVNAADKSTIESHAEKADSESVQTIPVIQGAVALIVNLPANCTATSTPAPGRLVLNNTTLEGIWHGTITKWSQITEEGDTVSGAGCVPTTEIQHVVREDGSGTTHIFKAYLALISSTPFETEKGESKDWLQIDEGAENTTWPKADAVLRASGGGGLVKKVAETPSSIGYANLADARANGGFSTTGGPTTSKFWVEVQDSGVTTKKAKYADPSTDADSAGLANANCAKTKYTNGKGTKFPPKSTADTWNEVTTNTKEKNYPICGLSYDMVLSKYSAYPGTSEGEATTASNFLTYVLEKKTGGGQLAIVNHDYEPVPTNLLKEANEGALRATF